MQLQVTDSIHERLSRILSGYLTIWSQPDTTGQQYRLADLDFNIDTKKRKRPDHPNHPPGHNNHPRKPKSRRNPKTLLRRRKTIRHPSMERKTTNHPNRHPIYRFPDQPIQKTEIIKYVCFSWY